MAAISKCQSGWPRECRGIAPSSLATHHQWSAESDQLNNRQLWGWIVQALIGKIEVFSRPCAIMAHIDRKKINFWMLVPCLPKPLTQALLFLPDQSDFVRAATSMQDNDNKPTIKAFKIQPHPKLYFSRTKRVSAIMWYDAMLEMLEIRFINQH